MPEILLLTLCGVIAGCEGWADIEEFGESKLAFLRKYLPYENGIPSDDTLRRFFRAIDPKSFEKQFTTWVKSLDLPGEMLIAIDGKTARRSYDADNQPLHLVSAFASEARLVLGQVKVGEKSNEIIAIPELLNWLDIRGSTVTIDAMGCQREIAKLIREKGGDYVLALKGNAPENMAIIRHFSLNLLQKYKKGRQSIRRLRKKAGWDNETLEGILGCSS